MANIHEVMSELDDYNNITTNICYDTLKLQTDLSQQQVSFNILHMNIRSIRKNFDEFIVYLDSIKQCNINLIVLTETWITNNINSYTIQGYDLYYNEAKFNQNDGVVVYVKNNFPYEVKNIFFTEVGIINIKIKVANTILNVINIYRAPSTEEYLFITELENLIKANCKNEVNIIIGDINFDLLDINKQYTLNYINTLQKYGYISYINQITRPDSGTCLDHIFIQNKSNNVTANQLNFQPHILPTSITDHHILFLNINFENSIHKEKSEQQKTYKKINIKKLCNYLETETWEGVINNNNLNVQIMTNNFMSILNKHIENCTTSLKINNNMKKLKPWITLGLITSIKHRDNLKKIYLKTKTEKDLQEFKFYRNYLNKLLKETKNNYYKNQIENAGNNYKKIWKTLNSVANIKNNSENNISLIIADDNEKITDKKQQAEVFNNYFIDIGKKLAANINKPNNYIPKVKLNRNSFYLHPVTESEIKYKINNLKNSSSCGKDGISVQIIKSVQIFIIKPLTYIINRIFDTCIIPTQFKESLVMPIFKQGDKQRTENYRPISLINNLAKIFEKCIKSRLSEFLEKGNLLSDNQYGFRQGRNTEQAIQKLTLNVIKNFNDNKKSIAIFLDLQKAFDTVSHLKLIEKLENIGIRGQQLNLFKNYLTNRQQSVKIDGEVSSAKIIETGVPQGTVLGPILFLIYLNEMFYLNDDYEIISFADDTVLLCSGDNWEKAYEEADKIITSIKQWLDENLLSLNLKKTKYITFAPSRADLPTNAKAITITNCTEKITKVDNIKYLGVIVDQHMNWQEHVNCLNQRIRKTIHKFFVLRNILSIKNLMIVYTCLIESILRYGITSWGFLYKSALQPLQISQNFILKTIFRKDITYPTSQLYKQYNVLDIRGLCLLNAIIYIKKLDDKEYIFHNHSTRGKLAKKLVLPKMNKTVCQRCILYLGYKIYNVVPENLKAIKTINKFKKEIKIYILMNINKLKDLINLH